MDVTEYLDSWLSIVIKYIGTFTRQTPAEPLRSFTIININFMKAYREYARGRRSGTTVRFPPKINIYF